jgi:hypothetical protein
VHVIKFVCFSTSKITKYKTLFKWIHCTPCEVQTRLTEHQNAINRHDHTSLSGNMQTTTDINSTGHKQSDLDKLRQNMQV